MKKHFFRTKILLHLYSRNINNNKFLKLWNQNQKLQKLQKQKKHYLSSALYQQFILLDVVLLVGYLMFSGLKLILLLFFSITCFSQKTEYYSYGYEGIERIYKTKDSTILFCNSKARPYIKDIVIDTLIKKYRNGKIKSGSIIINLDTAKVFGFIEVIKGKDKVKSIKITYQKVEYKSGLIEIYKKPKK